MKEDRLRLSDLNKNSKNLADPIERQEDSIKPVTFRLSAIPDFAEGLSSESRARGSNGKNGPDPDEPGFNRRNRDGLSDSLADFRAEFKAKAKTDSKVNAKADLELDFETESSTAEIVADMSQRTGINKDQNLLPASQTVESVYPGDFQSLKKLETLKRSSYDFRILAPSAEEEPAQMRAGVMNQDSGSAPQISVAGEEGHEEIYSDLKSLLGQIKVKIRDGRSFILDPVSGVISKIIEAPDKLQKIYPLTIPINDESDYNISHQVNTMIYALKMEWVFPSRGKNFTNWRCRRSFMMWGCF